MIASVVNYFKQYYFIILGCVNKRWQEKENVSQFSGTHDF